MYIRGRKVTLAESSDKPIEVHKADKINNGQTKKVNTSADTYEKPIPAEVNLIKLVLENFLGKDFDDSFADLSFELDNLTSNAEVNNIYESQQVGMEGYVTIAGQHFNADDMLNVKQWQTHKQSLTYQMQGQFELDGQSLLVDYSFALTSEHTQYQHLEMSASALKDPLIIQFSQQGLGQIIDTQGFDINSDNKLDTLPVFSGDVGYLVYDKNQNNKADNGGELFGPKSGDGFADLALLDSNNNGFIDSDDDAFEEIYIWQPEADDLAEQWLSLAEANIQAISTSAIATPFSFYNDNNEVSAQLRQSSFALSDAGIGYGVHQVDVVI